MANSNIINAVFGSGLCAVTTSAYRANYGMKLRFSGIELPTAFECDFSNYDTSNNDSITAIGQNGEVQIPDQLWDSGLNIYAYVYLHPTDDSGVTVYTVTIPVLGRPNRTEEQPTPHEQSVIEQAISALNDAVEQTAADVASADASAQAAAQSEANASVSERSAAASAGAALASQNAAESASQSATEQASASAESARNAANSASTAAEAATNAQASAEQAEQSAQSISGDVERAESAAATATEKATEAASSASTASGKANEASASATAAAQSASSASTAAQNAAASATAAESSATDAETAKSDAQDAQAAAEQAAESVSGLSAQIEQNTADIADLVQTKAGALIDTASGSIASFVPDSTIPTVKGLSVDIEPVQDLHGYDNPWPSGGGKNLLASTVTKDVTIVGAQTIVISLTEDVSEITIDRDLTASIGYRFNDGSIEATLSAGTYYFSSNISNQAAGSGLFVFNASTSAILARARVEGGGSFTLADTTTIRLGVSLSTTTTKGTYWFQLEKGSTATAYSPYSNICPISGWDGAKVTRTGKNLWGGEKLADDIAAKTAGATKNATAKTITYAASAIDEVVLFERFRPNTQYTVILNGTGYANMQLMYSDGTTQTFAGTLPTTSKAFASNSSKSITALIGTWSSGQTVLNYEQCGVFEGVVTAADFKPYQGDTYQIQLGQTVYGGTLDVTGGKMVVDRAMFTFTGAESFIENTAWGAYAKLYNTGVSILSSVTNERTISSHFKRSSGGGWGSLTAGLFMTAGGIYIGIGYDGSISELKEYLASQYSAGTPVQVVALLATPITVSLTPLEISVLTGQTNNVWADSGDVSVDYAADLKTYINNKIAAAVAALS